MAQAMIPQLALGLFGIVDKVLGALIPDPAARAKATTDILDGFTKLDLGQMEVNKQQAAHESVFVAGARPFILWVCGLAVAYEYLLVPVGIWVAAVCGYPLPVPPTISGDLWELMFGMLGLGALRSFEKVKGVSAGILKK